MDLLEQVYLKRVGENPKYSLRALARSLNCSPSHVSESLARKNQLSVPASLNLARTIGLSEPEVDYIVQLAVAGNSKDAATREYFQHKIKGLKSEALIVVNQEVREIFKSSHHTRTLCYFNSVTETHRQLHEFSVPTSVLPEGLFFVDRTFSESQNKFNLALIFKTKQGRYFIGGHTENSSTIKINRMNPDTQDFFLEFDLLDLPIFNNLKLRKLNDTGYCPYNLRFGLSQTDAFNLVSNTVTDTYKFQTLHR